MQKKARPIDVQTHRGELLPFTFNNIWDNPGAKRKRRRLGRGPGSTKGKTSGRGMKGQGKTGNAQNKARFEGGQTPLQRRLPKIIRRRYPQYPKAVNLDKVLYYIKLGRIDPTQTITMRVMQQAGVFNTAKNGIKLLSRGGEKINVPLHFDVSDASAKAIEYIKNKGGSVKCVYRTQLLIRQELKPYRFKFKLYDPVPTRQSVKQMERIKSRGAQVEYNVPEWKQAELKEEEEQQKDKKQKDQFKIPVDIYPGVGKDKIRKRKPKIWKTINYELE